MRTSRISRETTHVLNALSPSGRRSTRQSLQAFARNSHDDATTPPSPTAETRHASLTPSASSTIGKRKRDGPATGIKQEPFDTKTPRTSPRKAGAQLDDPSNPRKPRRQPAKRIKGPNGAVTVEPPANWETMYTVTAAMRKRILAPVDTMGCESLAEEHRTPRDQRLQTLVSLMLSSQTKDTVTAAAIKNLQSNLPGGLTLEALLKVEPVELNQLIEKVGFHNNKTKYIKATAEILRDQFAGDIPDTIDGLISLPGVGPKMAYLCMSAAWGRDEGIGVDVHVHRITNLWGWHKTSTPEQTRAELEAWLPREKWHDINHLLVGLGQTVCLPVGRKCGECNMATQGLCPSAEVRRASPVKKRVKREVEIKVEGVEDEVVEEQAEMVVQVDDIGVKIEADLPMEGRVEMLAMKGEAPEIETMVEETGG